MKRFVAEDSFWELFPEAEIGVVGAQGMKPASQVSEASAKELRRRLIQANEAADQHLTSNTISENEVVAVWREAYKAFKTKKGARSSVENLLKRVLKGNPVGSITPLVDMYNIISLKHALPVGGEDIDAMEGDIHLRITEGGDAFRALGDEEDSPTLEGELCYLDDAGAICCAGIGGTGSARRSRMIRRRRSSSSNPSIRSALAICERRSTRWRRW